MENSKELLTAIQHIRLVLEEIDRGAGFLEDRGFGRLIDLERRAGIDDVRALFDTRPDLSDLLPELGNLLRDRSRVIGLETIPHEEVKAAIRTLKRNSRGEDQA